MSIFVRIPPFFSLQSHNGLPWKPWNFKKQRAFIFEDNIFLHLSGPIGQIYAHNEMPYVINLGLITLLHTIVYPWLFSLIFKISLIFMNMQMRKLLYRTTGSKLIKLNHWGYKNGNHCGLMMFWCWNIFIYVVFLWFYFIFVGFNQYS